MPTAAEYKAYKAIESRFDRKASHAELIAQRALTTATEAKALVTSSLVPPPPDVPREPGGQFAQGGPGHAPWSIRAAFRELLQRDREPGIPYRHAIANKLAERAAGDMGGPEWTKIALEQADGPVGPAAGPTAIQVNVVYVDRAAAPDRM